MFAHISFRSARALAFCILASTAIACDDDDPIEPDDEPEVAAVRLTVGTSTVTVSTTASPTLDVATGTNNVTAEWLRSGGAVETLVTDAEFELRIAQASGTGTLAFTPTSARAGTLTVTGLNAGQTIAATVSLFHKQEQHTDFGPLNFTVRRP